MRTKINQHSIIMAGEVDCCEHVSELGRDVSVCVLGRGCECVCAGEGM